MLPQSLLKLPILAAVIRHTTESEQLTSESEQLNSKGHKKLLSIFFLQDFVFFSSLTDIPINLLQRLKGALSYSQILHKKLKFIQSYRFKDWKGHHLPTVIMIITKRSKLIFKDWFFQSNYTSPETLKKKKI